MGKLSRQRGCSYEREVVKELKKVFPECRRHLEFQVEEAVDGVDIVNTGKLRFQCKRGRKYCSLSKIKEIKKEGIKCLVTRADNENSIVCLYLDDFIKILEDIGTVYER